MADLDNILIFVKVAQFESISRAARSLGMPISTVSRRLSVLESELGVSLLRRTTRRVTLTAQGREYFSLCQEPLTLLQEAERVLTQAQKKPEGMLRISVPVILGQEPFLNFVSGFLKDHPRIRIDLFITNLFLDLVAENIDVAIRFGELQDSSLVATRIGKSIRYVVAAPEYLKGRKPPAEPADLKQHDCVMLNAKNNETEWDLLPKWASPQIPVFAVYPSRRFLPLRLSVFLEALATWKSLMWTRE
jgi:DNA-binding transcriptional LysR family regulator